MIHEVRFDEEGNTNSITCDPIYPAGESIAELKTAIEWLLEAIEKPVPKSPIKLDEEYFEPLSQRVWIKRHNGAG